MSRSFYPYLIALVTVCAACASPNPAYRAPSTDGRGELTDSAQPSTPAATSPTSYQETMVLRGSKSDCPDMAAKYNVALMKKGAPITIGCEWVGTGQWSVYINNASVFPVSQEQVRLANLGSKKMSCTDFSEKLTGALVENDSNYTFTCRFVGTGRWSLTVRSR